MFIASALDLSVTRESLFRANPMKQIIITKFPVKSKRECLDEYYNVSNIITKISNIVFLDVTYVKIRSLLIIINTSLHPTMCFVKFSILFSPFTYLSIFVFHLILYFVSYSSSN